MLTASLDRICFCNNVDKATLIEAILEGCDSLEKIYDRTSAGVGACGGSCRAAIQNLLQSAKAPVSPSVNSTSPAPSAEVMEAVSLFNRRYYWETHEILEHVWLEENRSSEKIFYQGLIQAAAALYHVLNANPKGVLRLGEEAKKKLYDYLPSHNQIHIVQLVDKLDVYIQQSREILGKLRSGFDYDQLPTLILGQLMDLKLIKKLQGESST